MNLMQYRKKKMQRKNEKAEQREREFERLGISIAKINTIEPTRVRLNTIEPTRVKLNTIKPNVIDI